MPDENPTTTMEPATANPYRIFISYTNEDSGIASALYDALKQAYSNGNDLRVDLMRDFQSGVRWREQIDGSLRNADLLLLVYTGNPRQGWTGYEVGFFSNDIIQAPFRFDNVKREIVPVNLLGERESVTDDIQGVVIEGIHFPEQSVTRPNIVVDQLTETESRISRATMRNDQLYKLFYKIANNIEAATNRPTVNEDRQARDGRLEDTVVKLYQTLHTLLRERPSDDDGLQNKLIVSTFPGHIDALAIDTIEFQNAAEKFFNISGLLPEGSSRLKWSTFEKGVLEKNDKQLAALWIGNLKELMRSALKDKFVDNNLLIPSPSQDKTYRAVVTRIVSFYSGRKDIHIYLIELYKRSGDGDRLTSMFADAVEIGCRYRSLFLEPESKFAPKWMEILSDDNYKQRALQLINAFDLIRQDSIESELDSPKSLAKIYGPRPTGVDLVKLAGDVREGQTRLRNAAAGVFLADQENFAARKIAFGIELLKFCLLTYEINSDYVARAMDALNRRSGEIQVEMQGIVEGWKEELKKLTKSDHLATAHSFTDNAGSRLTGGAFV